MQAGCLHPERPGSVSGPCLQLYLPLVPSSIDMCEHVSANISLWVCEFLRGGGVAMQHNGAIIYP